MKSENLLPTIIWAASIIVTALISGKTVDNYWQKKADLEEKRLLIEAVYQCGQTATVEWEDNQGSKITEPFKPAYENCLRDKGY